VRPARRDTRAARRARAEFCDRGSLSDMVRASRFRRKPDAEPDLPAIIRCLIDVASGMDYLHSANVVHGDLKSANVLLRSTATDSRGFTCKARPCSDQKKAVLCAAHRICMVALERAQPRGGCGGGRATCVGAQGEWVWHHLLHTSQR